MEVNIQEIVAARYIVDRRGTAVLLLSPTFTHTTTPLPTHTPPRTHTQTEYQVRWKDETRGDTWKSIKLHATTWEDPEHVKYFFQENKVARLLYDRHLVINNQLLKKDLKRNGVRLCGACTCAELDTEGKNTGTEGLYHTHTCTRHANTAPAQHTLCFHFPVE